MAITYGDCLAAAAENVALVREYDRLKGTRLSTLAQRTPINALIDEATGKDQADAVAFAQFVYSFIFIPLVLRDDSKESS